MAGPFAWVLNLDAELELERPRGYRPTRAVAAFVARHAAAARALLGPGDVVVRPGEPLADARRFVGRAWCPTPSAQAALRAAGVSPEPAPALDVLRAVNDRAFAAALEPPLPGGGYVRTRRELDALLAARPEVDDWLLKRAFGFAGRGQRPLRCSAPLAADADWVARALARGGLAVEPRVAIELELATHGAVAQGGAVLLGPPTVQRVERGAWTATRALAAGELSADERAALERCARRAGAALARAGYFGPFGVDAFVWRDAAGGRHLRPLGELNARYSMGFARGFGRPLE